MPSNDIIDNRDQILTNDINCILGSTEAVKLTVAYFFLSGLAHGRFEPAYPDRKHKQPGND
jgi:hypothetical protein